MPAKYEHVEFCRLSKRQRELYDGFLGRADTRETLSSGNYLSIINCLMQLRKVCNHPDLFVDRPILTSFRLPKSVPADYESTAHLVQKRLRGPALPTAVNLDTLLPPLATSRERTSGYRRADCLSRKHDCRLPLPEFTTSPHLFPLYQTIWPGISDGVSPFTKDVFNLKASETLTDLRNSQHVRSNFQRLMYNMATVESSIVQLEYAARWKRFDELHSVAHVNMMRLLRIPIYGKRLVDFFSLRPDQWPSKPSPTGTAEGNGMA